MRFYEFRENTNTSQIYVIGDSHAAAMGGSNNLAVNGARLDAIQQQATQVPNGATVWMSGGHNDVAAGSQPQTIASKVMTIMQMLERRGCTVNYVLFPEGSGTANQENMAPTREAIGNLVDVAHDLDGSPMQNDGIHATLSSYRNIITSRGNNGSVTRSDRGQDGREPDEETQGFDGLKAGPPYPPEEYDAVKDMQRKLEDLGYSVGSTGIDGKFGPRTTRAVRAYKADNSIETDATMVTASELSALATAERVANPTPVNQPGSRGSGGSIDDLGDLASLDNMDQAMQVVAEFLGREVDDDEMNYLIRGIASEASPNNQERAAVCAVILNRARSGRFPNNIIDVLEQDGQFQAVTGTYDRSRRQWTGPHSNFTNMSDSTGAQVIGAIIRYLPQMDRSWLNFTSNNERAYGPGTNINFMYTMRQSPGAEIIGQTVFGTV